MSSYLSVFIQPKSADTNYLFPIADFSRSSWIYKNCNAPYGCVRKLSVDTMENLINRLEIAIVKSKGQIKEITNNIKLIQGMPNSVAEKLEAINDAQKAVQDINEYVDDLIQQQNALDFILNQIYYNNNTVFVGIDVSDEPRIE